uniref:C-type lectin domain-containing protein n=1 Tax=Parastrongyloides trichosuri TaxID=131310 RepID=A0A0N4Z3Y6_PARTI
MNIWSTAHSLINTTDIAKKYCSSNGIPIFVPSKFLYNFSNQNDYFYNGKSYRILPVIDKANWKDSINVCKNIGFNLLEVSSADEVLAIQTIILSNFETDEICYSDFWIGGTAQWSNTSGLQWIWDRSNSPENGIITNFFWENDKEEPFIDYEDKCIKITRNSWYKQWKVTSCLENNRVICEKDIKDEIEESFTQIQCECNEGYSGLFCNRTSTDYYTNDNFACGNGKLFFECPKNTRIHVNYAEYGIFNDKKYICDNSNVENDKLFNCTDSFSLQSLKSFCQGKEQCYLEKVSSIFDYSICSKNPLSGLKYRMECIDENQFNKCTFSFEYVDNKCLKIFLNEKETWFNARKICSSFGADLIEPKVSTKVQAYINQEINNIENNFFWQLGYLSDSNISNNSCPKVSFDNNNLNLHLLNCNEKINFICEKPSSTSLDEYLILDEATKSQSKEVTYLQTFSSTSRCPSITWSSLTFNETDLCTTSNAICGDEGQLAYLKCGCLKNEWVGLPNTKRCVHSFFNDIDKQIKENIDINILTDLLYKNINDYMSNGELYAGDLIESITTIDKLIDYEKKIKINETESNIFIKNVAKTGDSLLSEDNRDNWNILEENGGIKKNISLLIDLLEDAIYSINKTSSLSMNESELLNWEFLYIPDYRDLTSVSGRNLFVSTSQVSFPYIQLPSIEDIQNTIFRRKRNSLQNDTMQLNVAYYLYKNMYWLLKPNSTKILNSHVIGTTINSPNESVYFKNNNTVKITLKHIRKNNIENVTCVYWDKKKLIWNTSGCYVYETNLESTICACNHLTNFAILVDVRGDELNTLSQGAADALELISIFGCALSVIFLVVSIIIFQCLPSIHTERIYIHRNLCITLLTAELTFIIGIHRTASESGCRAVAILLHFLFLSAFCWMLVEGCELYRLLVKVFEPDETHMHYYYAFSVFFPAIVVAFSAGFGWKNYGTFDYCWIDAKSGLIWTFIGPIIFIILVNVIILFIALKVVLSVRSRDRKTGSKIMGWLKGSSTLLCLLGITWVFGFISAIRKVEPIFTFVFTILNSLQGIFIFVLHILLNDKIQKALIKCCLQKAAIFKKSDITNNHTKISETRQTSLTLWQKIKLSILNELDNYSEEINSTNEIPSSNTNSFATIKGLQY